MKTQQTLRTIEIGEIYEHFKRPEGLPETDGGHRYEVIALAQHTETQEMLVVYKALYPPYAIFARPYTMFMGLVDIEKYPDCKKVFRFTKVSRRSGIHE